MEGSGCNEANVCHYTVYDESASTTFQNGITTTNSEYLIRYKSPSNEETKVTATGVLTKDMFCLDSFGLKCGSPSLQFVLATTGVNMKKQPAPGMLGLAPLDSTNTAESYIYMLKLNKAIEKQQFTLYYGYPEDISKAYIEFGSTTTSFKYAGMPNLSLKWKLSMREDNMIGAIQASGVVFDSSSQWSYMPTKDFQVYKTNFFKYKDWMNCTEIDGQMICYDCDSSKTPFFDPLEIGLGTKNQAVKLTLKGPAHMHYNTTLCLSTFRSSPALDSQNYWVLGGPIYQAFIINHDSDNMQIGFASDPTNSISSVADLVTTSSSSSSGSQATFAVKVGVTLVSAGVISISNLMA